MRKPPLVLLAGLALAAQFATSIAREPLDPGAACRVLQKAIAKRDGLPETGPPGAGWFCDIAPSKDPNLYVIALRAGKPDPYSNLIGWYAVARASGAIYAWDVAAQRAIPMKASGNGTPNRKATMRTHGTLIKWNDDRGFGFISSAGGKEEIFVHVSAFPRDKRPQLHELISFETEVAPDGRRRAVRIMRPAQRTAPAAARGRGKKPAGMRVAGGWIATLIAIAGLGFYGYTRHRSAPPPSQVESRATPPEPAPVESMATLSPSPQAESMATSPPPVESAAPRPAAPAASRFHCDGRTMCSQMTSCAEATFFIRNCPATKMDGDNDGVPCESQWCN